MARFNTHQEVLNHVVPFLMAQGKRAGQVQPDPQGNPRFFCQYVTPDGSRCAIGACFENIAAVATYNMGIEDLQIDRPELYNETFGPDVDRVFLAQLQNVHDTAFDDNFWLFFSLACGTICTRWNLTMPEVN